MPKLISQKNFSNVVPVNKTTTSLTETVIDSFSKRTFQSAKYQIQVERGGNYQTTELLVVHDNLTTYMTEYGTIQTGDTLASFTTDLSGSSIRLLATPTSATETKFKVIRKAINA